MVTKSLRSLRGYTSSSPVAPVAASFGRRLGTLREVSTATHHEHARGVWLALILMTDAELTGPQAHPFEDATRRQAADAYLHEPNQRR